MARKAAATATTEREITITLPAEPPEAVRVSNTPSSFQNWSQLAGLKLICWVTVEFAVISDLINYKCVISWKRNFSEWRCNLFSYITERTWARTSRALCIGKSQSIVIGASASSLSSRVTRFDSNLAVVCNSDDRLGGLSASISSRNGDVVHNRAIALST